jgi:predicted AAA+ superfamily ATPase
LKLKYKLDLPKITFKELLTNHENISMDYWLKLKYSYFEEYLKSGVYPFGLVMSNTQFIVRLQNTMDKVILEDLKYIRNYETQSLTKLSKLIYFIATTPPSELSISHLSQKIQLDKNVVDSTLYLLNKI